MFGVAQNEGNPTKTWFLFAFLSNPGMELERHRPLLFPGLAVLGGPHAAKASCDQGVEAPDGAYQLHQPQETHQPDPQIELRGLSC